MSRRELTSLYVIGENPAQSDADLHHVQDALAGLDHLVVQEIFLTKTAEYAHVVLPAAATWCEGEGTVTNSERRVQRVRKVVEPPDGREGRALDHLGDRAPAGPRLGHADGRRGLERVPRRRAALRRRHELRAARGARRHPVAVPRRIASRRDVPPRPPVGSPAPRPRRRRSPSCITIRRSNGPDDEYPLVLTTGRRLESYNTGVQTAGYDSPLHRGETLDISPEDAARLGIDDGDLVRIESRRGTVEAPARIDHGAPRRHGLHDAAFPRRSGDQPADHRRVRSRSRAPPSSRPARSGWRACVPRSRPSVDARPVSVAAKGAH